LIDENSILFSGLFFLGGLGIEPFLLLGFARGLSSLTLFLGLLFALFACGFLLLRLDLGHAHLVLALLLFLGQTFLSL